MKLHKAQLSDNRIGRDYLLQSGNLIVEVEKNETANPKSSLVFVVLFPHRFRIPNSGNIP